MDFEFVGGFGPIASDMDATHAFWAGALGVPFHHDNPGYFHNFDVPGTKCFALWSLAQAAEATFGTPEWPAEWSAPRAWIEFELASPEAVGQAAEELRQAGQELLQDTHQDPWGQTTARLLSPRGYSWASRTSRISTTLFDPADFHARRSIRRSPVDGRHPKQAEIREL